MGSIRFEIVTKDRLGITVEVLQKIYNRNINLISMEVFTKKVCIKIEEIDCRAKDELLRELESINDVISVEEIELLYHEQNERRLYAVINSVDEGIISIDKSFNIITFNDYCEELFNCKKEDILDKDLRTIIGEESLIYDLIKKSIEYDNIEVSSKVGGNIVNYITTGRTIKNDYGETIGGVVSIKDFNKAKKLVEIVSNNNEEDAFKDIIGNSLAIQRVKDMVRVVAKNDSIILLRGESGTGKELFAKAIHELSHRRNESFIVVNCAALPEALLESELFGYEKGSFTGAKGTGKEGLFKEATNGTLFLDEIGEMSPYLQAKLLRVIQESKIRRIGSNKEEEINVRIITATNRNLEEMIKIGTFREDLYYRLNVIPMYTPPLKERLEDIPMLVKFFVEKFNKKMNKEIKGANPDFLNALMEHIWNGNIRELQNVIERAMNLCGGNMLTLKDLLIDFKDSEEFSKKGISRVNLEEGLSLKDIMDMHEERALINAIKEHKSYRKAAKALNVSHTTIMNKVKKYNIEL